MQKQVKTQKSTNNLMSSFGLIEENMELYHIDLAVNWDVHICKVLLLKKNSMDCLIFLAIMERFSMIILVQP